MTTSNRNVPSSQPPAQAGPIRPQSLRQWLGLVLGITVPLGPPLALHLFSAFSILWAVTGALWRSQRRWARLARPLLALGAIFPLVYLFALRPRMHRWGATETEAAKPLPGDEATPHPALRTTHAVTINAPVADVWPWLAQIGQREGGFYSYAWLENLAGCEIKNADRIHPEWQQRAVGDAVYLHPALPLKLCIWEPPRTLGLEGWGTWVLEALDATHTRLLARSNIPAGAAAWFFAFFIEIPHFIMQRKMLLGIKRRAERMAQQ